MEIKEEVSEGFYIIVNLIMSFPNEINILLGIILFGCPFLIFILSKIEKFNAKKQKIDKVIVEPTINFDENYYFETFDFYIDEYQYIDKITIKPSGVYLFFYYKSIKGVVRGQFDDEFFFNNKAKMINPFNQKNSYIEKMSKILKVDKNLINLVFVFPNSKSIISKSVNVVIKDSDYKYNQKENINFQKFVNLKI